MTYASFIKDGTSPVPKDLLKLISDGISNESITFWCKILLISSWPEPVLFGNFFIKFNISFLVHECIKWFYHNMECWKYNSLHYMYFWGSFSPVSADCRKIFAKLFCYFFRSKIVNIIYFSYDQLCCIYFWLY